MKWFPLSSTGHEPEYHLTSTDDVRSALAQWKRRYYTLATLYIITILLVIAYIPMSDSLATGMVRSEAYFGNSLFSFVVNVPKEMVEFRLDEAFVDAGSATLGHQPAWDILLPLGKGLVEVQNPVNFGLRGGLPVPNTKGVTEIYSISMFHQIHCLSILKDAFGRDRGSNEHQAAENDLGHCFDYLRQAIMCTGDTTLETALVNEDGKLVPDFNGWGDVHECRSYEAIYDFAQAHRVNDETVLSKL